MIERFIEQLQKDLELEKALKPLSAGTYTLPLDENFSIALSENPQGFLFTATVGEAPTHKIEHFYTRMLMGNLFGQGTYGATLGLNDEANELVLSYSIESDSDYKNFKAALEDFLNACDLWKDEILAHSAVS